MTEISYLAPATRYEPPNDRELAALLKIVEAGHPEWSVVVELEEFRLAMAAVGAMFRLDAPSSQYAFTHFLEEANIMLRRHGTINGPALLRAVAGHNDVPWRASNRSIGQVCELGLDLYSGRACSNGWKRVLAGDALRAPLPPRRILVEQAAPSPMRIFRQDRPGDAWQDVASDAPLWRS